MSSNTTLPPSEQIIQNRFPTATYVKSNNQSSYQMHMSEKNQNSCIHQISLENQKNLLENSKDSVLNPVTIPEHTKYQESHPLCQTKTDSVFKQPTCKSSVVADKCDIQNLMQEKQSHKKAKRRLVQEMMLRLMLLW